ncbi:MAG: tripartite tricarboxylate transporter substrate-binding protein [Burkholderiales bacterium]
MLRTAITLVTLLAAASALAQEHYPSRAIQLVIPAATATTSDVLARFLADRLAKRVGQQVIVQNRPGAGGTMAAAAVAKAPADGYTIFMVNLQHSLNPLLYDNLTFDTLKDFAGILQFGDAPSLVMVHPSLGVKNLAEFIALAKKNPGKINYGSAGVGTTTHLAAAYLAHRAGIDLLHVPYKGPEIRTDILAGRINSVVAPVPYLLGPIKEGKVLALAVTSRTPLHSPVDAPTVESAAGLKDFSFSTYYGFVAAAQTPKPIVEQLGRDIKAIVEEPEMTQWLNSQAIYPKIRMGSEFDAYIKAEMDRMAPVVKATGARGN